jgi:cell division protein FtsI (penicillin-binding protein 3)
VSWAAGQRWVRVRLVVAGAVFAGLFVLLGANAWQLQVREGRRLREMAEDQYLRDIELPSRRGRILDRNGAELAASALVDSVYVNPRQIQAGGHRDTVARALAHTLHLERREVARALGSRRYFAWVKRRLDPDEARALRAQKLPGVYLTREPRRYYPNRSLGGSLLGWAGVDGRGLEGVELRWDKELRGEPAEVQGLRDALGREVLPAGIAEAGTGSGHDVVLTVDKFIQYRLERALEQGVERHRAKAGVALALDPRSGEILAMASVPTVNPNDPSGARERGARNRPVTDPFEPGSTMKTFSIAAAVEAGLVRPDEKWFCENGKYPIGSALIHDAEKIGVVTTTQVLAESSNICTAKIARRSGRDRVDAMLRRFSFGAPTGVDLPGERAGLLRPARRWGEIELATISFGQGMTATPLQVAAGYAAVANGGTWYKPHVVRRVLDERGQPVAEIAAEGRRVLDERTARTMREMLAAVVGPGGTGEKLVIPGYPAAGKTGTAQKVDPVTRHYSTDKWASSFVGFAPLDDPRLVLMVVVDEPSGTHYGGAVAGPIWREVMTDALRYLTVPPSVEALAEAPRVVAPAPVAVAAPVEEEADEGDDDGAPHGGFLAARGEAGDAREIPDFTGLSLGEALEAARRAGLPVEIAGTGRVVGQSPAPGRAPQRARCRLALAPPG